MKIRDYFFPKRSHKSKLPLLPRHFSSSGSAWGDPQAELEDQIETLKIHGLARTKHDAHRVLIRHKGKAIDQIIKDEKRRRRKPNHLETARRKLLELFGLAR